MIGVFELMVDLEPIYSSLLITKILYVSSAVGILLSGKKIITYQDSIEMDESPSTKLYFTIIGWYAIGCGFFCAFNGTFFFLKGWL